MIIPWLLSKCQKMFATAWPAPEWSQEAGTQPSSLTCVAGTQLIELSPAAYPGMCRKLESEQSQDLSTTLFVWAIKEASYTCPWFL